MLIMLINISKFFYLKKAMSLKKEVPLEKMGIQLSNLFLF